MELVDGYERVPTLCEALVARCLAWASSQRGRSKEELDGIFQANESKCACSRSYAR